MLLVHLARSEDLDEPGVTLAESTFRRLLRSITSGELVAGSDIAEEKLAEDLQVSRTPLRDAIRRLESLGLLVRRTNRTLLVPELSFDEMEDLSRTREALEGLIVKRVAQRVGSGEVSAERLQDLHTRLKGLAALRDDRFSLEAGLDFHRELYRLAKAPSAVGLLDQIAVRLERYRQLAKGHPERSSEIIKEHEKIIEAITSGDDIKAEKLMSAHIRAGREFYAQMLAKRGRPNKD